MTKVNKENKVTRTEVKEAAKQRLLNAIAFELKAIDGSPVINIDDGAKLETRAQARRVMEFLGYESFQGI